MVLLLPSRFLDSVSRSLPVEVPQVLPGIDALDDAPPPSTREGDLDLVLELLAHIEKKGGSEDDMRRVLVAAAAVKKQKSA